jgi:hypothetical protein
MPYSKSQKTHGLKQNIFLQVMEVLGYTAKKEQESAPDNHRAAKKEYAMTSVHLLHTLHTHTVM